MEGEVERESDKPLISLCTCCKTSNILLFSHLPLKNTCAPILIVQHELNFKVTSSALGCEHSSLVQTIINQYSALTSLFSFMGSYGVS